jgi:hypothetical protein
MKITIAQLDYHIGNFEGNTSKMIAAIQKRQRISWFRYCMFQRAWQHVAILPEIFLSSMILLGYQMKACKHYAVLCTGYCCHSRRTISQ